MESDQLKTERKKSSKTEPEKSLSKEFIRALNLLYAPEAKSAQQLRVMLEIEIAKQKRPKRTKSRTHRKPSKWRKISTDILENEQSNIEKSVQAETGSCSKQKYVACNLHPDVEEVVNKDDIPRISIPDEDQNDGAVCKVCNFPEFGQLTLTQCNTCEKYYHPLCHQPPIVDSCFQKSNSLWHCGECKKVG